MAANVKGNRLTATLTPVAFVKGRQLKGVVAGTVGVKGRQLKGNAGRLIGVKGRTLSGQVSIAAGAPIVSPGPAQQVGGGSHVHLAASVTASNPGGPAVYPSTATLPAGSLYPAVSGVTVASWTWRLVTRDPGSALPVLSATNVQFPTFYAPVDPVKRSYTFGVTAQDSLGRQSAEGLVTVTVLACDYLLATIAGWSVGSQDSYAIAGEWT